MKILHVIALLDPARGGPPAVAARLAAAQAHVGTTVSILSRASQKRRVAMAQDFERVPHMQLVGLEDADVRKLYGVVEGYDLLHLHGVWDPLLLAASVVARRSGVPYVVRPCGMLDPWSLSQKRWKKKFAMAMGYRRMLDNAAFLHALNLDEKRLIEPLDLHCPIDVIPNGVFFEEIEPLPPHGQFRSAHPELMNDPYVLFLSRLHYKKGLDYLAEGFAYVAKHHPTARLVVAGPDGGAQHDFERLVAEANLADRVHVVGPLYGPDKFAAMVDAACFCLPSRQEGFSVAVLEALACGLPAVISTACHFPEVKDSHAGYIVEPKADAIGDALNRVLTDPASAAAMGKAGRELVASRYTWPRIAEQTIAAYEGIVRSPRPTITTTERPPAKIVHVISSLDPAGGGPPMVATRLAAAQAATGQIVSIISFRWTGPGADLQIHIPGGELVKQHLLERPRTLEQVLAARREVDHIIADADWLHLHGVWDPLLKISANLAARHDIPYVVAPHGMLDPWSLQQKRWKKKLALAMGYRRMLDRAAFLHALNEDEKRLIEPLELKCPVEVIPNGVFLEEIEPMPARGAFRATRPEIGDRPYILFLSRLHTKKGLDFLADAFAILASKYPDLRLVVAGPDGGARGDFEKQVAKASLSDRVHLVGPLYGPDKFAAMVDAACFCLPSRQEGFSVAVLEALACGLPVVISDACHFPEVQQAGAGEIVPLEPQKIANAIASVLDHPEHAKEMGQAGRELVAAAYTWPKIAEYSLDAYAHAEQTRNGIVDGRLSGHFYSSTGVS